MSYLRTCCLGLGILLVSNIALAGEVLKRRISLDVKDQAPEVVFRLLGDSIDATVDVQGAFPRPITITLEDVTLRTTLDAICESVGCRWRVLEAMTEPGRPQLIVTPLPDAPRKEERVELDTVVVLKFRDARASEVLFAIASIARLRLEVPPEIDTSILVTIEVLNQPLRLGLDAVCERLSCSWDVLEGEKPVLRIGPRGLY